MAERYDLKTMLEEIERDRKVGKVLEKKWASQDDIKKMIREIKDKRRGV